MSGPGVHRIEAFSDAVFAFALTLLVVSLEVPDSFDELLARIRGFIPFAASFAIVAWLSGYLYMLPGPVHAVWGKRSGRARKRIEAQTVMV